jgi:hypothetical protein
MKLESRKVRNEKRKRKRKKKFVRGSGVRVAMAMGFIHMIDTRASIRNGTEAKRKKG